MRTLLIISITLGILHGASRASESDSLKHLDSLFAPETGSISRDFVPFPTDYCAPLPIEGKCPQPDYPAKALADSVEGRVNFWVHVDTTGHVDRWHIIQEIPEGYGFGLEAERAMRNWEFSPASQSGRVFSEWITIPFSFRLPK